MVEMSLFPNRNSEQPVSKTPIFDSLPTFRNDNGEVVVDWPVDTTPSAHLDAEKGVFVTSTHNEIALSGKGISALMLERITNEGKPKIPRQEVTLLGKHKELHANPNDPGYLALLAEWQDDQNIRVMRYMFNVGVAGVAPEDFADEQRQFFPNATDADLKYLWVASMLPDADIDKFTEAIMGRGLTTVKGLEEAANFSASE